MVIKISHNKKNNCYTDDKYRTTDAHVKYSLCSLNASIYAYSSLSKFNLHCSNRTTVMTEQPFLHFLEYGIGQSPNRNVILPIEI